jgi:hypothetical protein
VSTRSFRSPARGRALAPARGRSTGSTKPGEWIADFMVKYLNTKEPIPFHFQFLLSDWVDEEDVQGVDEDTSVEDLKPKLLRQFAAWLKGSDGERAIGKAMRNEPEMVPDYIVMQGARRLPAGSWCLHYTRRDPFSSFEYGARLGTPLWYTGGGNQRAARAACPGNLSERGGIFDVVFGFAFSARQGRFSGYGDNAVLFRSDVAIECYHAGDEYDQVVFPICSEYDAIPIWRANGSGGGLVETVSGEEEFDTVADIIEAFDGGKIKREGRALGTTRKGRWHPLVALPRAR